MKTIIIIVVLCTCSFKTKVQAVESEKEVTQGADGTYILPALGHLGGDTSGLSCEQKTSHNHAVMMSLVVGMLQDLNCTNVTPQQWDTLFAEAEKMERMPWREPAAPGDDIHALAVAASAAHSLTNEIMVIIGEGRKIEPNDVSLFAGLAYWIDHGGRPLHNGSFHLAEHIVYGALAQAVFDRGYEAAILKETSDKGHGGEFNLDEMRASMEGSDLVSPHTGPRKDDK